MMNPCLLCNQSLYYIQQVYGCTPYIIFPPWEMNDDAVCSSTLRIILTHFNMQIKEHMQFSKCL